MEYGIKFNKEDLAKIVTRESRKNAYHPVKTFIESKDWDGVERVESVFIDYLGVGQSLYKTSDKKMAYCRCYTYI